MAQLIKLRDYVSRYEWNVYRYPSQFIRMKQQHWQDLQETLEDERQEMFIHQEANAQKESLFTKWTNLFKREQTIEETVEPKPLPTTEHEVRKYFLDRIFPLQLKWATSTVSEVSFYKPSFETDETLKYFLNRFPDIYLVMYKPVFSIKQAPIEGEIIVISPIGIEIIYLLEAEKGAIFHAGDDRVWMKETLGKQETVMSPFIALKRNESIIRSILHKYGLQFPIHKTILSREHSIVSSTTLYQTQVIDKHNEQEWLLEKRNLNSTLKRDQLKVIEVLLQYCQTHAVKRPEWKDDKFETPFNL